jgi:hypothetical protein
MMGTKKLHHQITKAPSFTRKCHLIGPFPSPFLVHLGVLGALVVRFFFVANSP